MHTLSALRRFAHEHDDLPAFRAGYLVIAVLAAALFNVGAFALLILAHISLDIVKYRELHGRSWRGTGEGIIRENLHDVMLLMIALAFSTYLHHTIGIAAVSGVIRADLTFLRLVATIVPKFEILQDFCLVLGHLGTYLRAPHLRLGLPWTPGEKLCFFFITSCIALLVLAPLILGLTAGEYAHILSMELIPWKM